MSDSEKENKIFKRLSKEHGFDRAYEREEPQITRRRRTKGPLRSLNISMPENEFERFVKICDAMDKTYWQGLCELMDLYERDKGDV